jgi:hypothetical protein
MEIQGQKVVHAQFEWVQFKVIANVAEQTSNVAKDLALVLHGDVFC